MNKYPLNQKQLNVWNVRKTQTFGISCNENINIRDNLPCKETRAILRKCHDHYYGICNPSGKISLGQFKKYIELHNL